MDNLQSQTLKEAAWRSGLLRHAQSGNSIAAFCRDEAVSTASFHICDRIGGDAVGQQTPFDRLDAGWRPIFTPHDAGRDHRLVLSGAQFHAAGPQVLAHDARLGAGACRQGEFDLAEWLALRMRQNGVRAAIATYPDSWATGAGMSTQALFQIFVGGGRIGITQHATDLRVTGIRHLSRILTIADN